MELTLSNNLGRYSGVVGGQIEELALSGTVTSSGNSVVLRGFGAARRLRCQLDITAVSGTSPSITVEIQDTIDGGTRYNTLTNFSGAKTATGVTVADVTTPFGDALIVKYAVTGTTPSFTFSVRILSEVDG